MVVVVVVVLQVLYPSPVSDGVNRETVSECLKEVGLSYLGGGKGLDWEDEWASRLSRGESQRVAIARVLYHQPEVGLGGHRPTFYYPVIKPPSTARRHHGMCVVFSPTSYCS